MSQERERAARMAYLDAKLEAVRSWWGEGEPATGHSNVVVTLAYIRQEAARLLRETPPEAELERARLRNIHRRAERLLALLHELANS